LLKPAPLIADLLAKVAIILVLRAVSAITVIARFQAATVNAQLNNIPALNAAQDNMSGFIYDLWYYLINL